MHAQMENYLWYFGNNAGMDFRDLQTYTNATLSDGRINQTVTGIPRSVRGPVYTYEGCFSVCDQSGNFLMASDGMTVYNGSLSTDIMDNGQGLHGHSSSTQSGIFVPRPARAGEYYVITGWTIEQLPLRGINYSIVDMNQNGGSGRVTVKNIPLNFGGARIGTDGTGAVIDRLESYEGLSAYPHHNGVDFWLVNRTRDKFFAWRITTDGIGPAPERVSQANEDGGQIHMNSSPGEFYAALAYTKFSVDGTLLAHSFTRARRIGGVIDPRDRSSYLTICRFNNSTGEVTPGVTRTMQFVDNGYFYGLEFSQNNKFLFYTAISDNPQARVWRIPASRYFTTLDGDLVIPTTTFQASNIGIGPDNKLYCIGDCIEDLLVFQNPDEGATDWIRIPDYFSSTNPPRLGLPNFLYSFFNINGIEVNPNSPCMGSKVSITVNVSITSGLNSIDKIVWDFGDGSAPFEQTDFSDVLHTCSHIYKKRGIYTFTLTPYSGSTELTDKIQTVSIRVSSCRIPVNHNRSVMGY